MQLCAAAFPEPEKTQEAARARGFSLVRGAEGVTRDLECISLKSIFLAKGEVTIVLPKLHNLTILTNPADRAFASSVESALFELGCQCCQSLVATLPK